MSVKARLSTRIIFAAASRPVKHKTAISFMASDYLMMCWFVKE